MKTFKPAPPAPAPEEDPEQAPEPVPAPHPRRRFIQPTFKPASVPTRPSPKVVVMTMLLTFGLGFTAPAQSTPGTPPALSPQQPAQQGWVMFDDRVAKELQLPADQVQRLRDMDMRYQKDYLALGPEPWTNEGYSTLTDRRTSDIRNILTPEEYDRWNTRYNTLPPPPPPPGDLDKMPR